MNTQEQSDNLADVKVISNDLEPEIKEPEDEELLSWTKKMQVFRFLSESTLQMINSNFPK